jgi:serpin B
MKRHFLPMLLVLSLFWACRGEEGPSYAFTALSGTQPVIDPTTVEPALTNAAADAQRAFTAELYRHILALPGQDGKNLVVSPYSIFSAFNLLYPGAAGHTEAAMRAGFFLEGPAADIFAGQGALDQTIRAHSTKRARLEIANAAFLETTFPVHQDYLDTMTHYYGADLFQADFLNQPDFMRTEINRWVEDHTARKIQDLLPEGSIGSNTWMVLVNAVYFNAKWKTTFEDGVPMTFRGVTGDQAFTSMRVELADARLYDSAIPLGVDPPPADRLQILAIPYQDDRFDMLIFLPDDFAGFSATLDGTTLGTLLAQTYESQAGTVEVNMPEFTINWGGGLNDLLKEMGLGPLFCDAEPAADFSAMTSAFACVSAVFHQAFIEVNKKGTEAAAATAIVVVNNSNGGTVTPFTVDRPFLYAIVDRETRTILFLGHIIHL